MEDRRNLRGNALGSDCGQTPSGLVVYAGAAHSPVWRGLGFNPPARPSSPHTNVEPPMGPQISSGQYLKMCILNLTLAINII